MYSYYSSIVVFIFIIRIKHVQVKWTNMSLLSVLEVNCCFYLNAIAWTNVFSKFKFGRRICCKVTKVNTFLLVWNRRTRNQKEIMATYLLAYLGYQEWKNSETTDDDSAEQVTDQNSNKCEIILDSLRKVNKKLLLIIITLLAIILLLMLVRRFMKIRKRRRERNYISDKNYNSNC